MLIIGCDFHTRYQQIAMANDETGFSGNHNPAPRSSPKFSLTHRVPYVYIHICVICAIPFRVA